MRIKLSYDWQFGFLWQYHPLILRGIAVTLLFAVGTNIIGLAIGLVAGLLRQFGNTFLAAIPLVYIEFFRCTPLLVQLVWTYYALPMLTGIEITAYTAATLTLSLYAGAFYAEIFRGGLAAVDKGQWDAGRAIGMRWTQCLRRIILPQAFHIMIPPIINQSVLQLKNTSLISTVAVADLLYQGSIITAATYRPLEVYTMIALVYFVLLFPATVAARTLEKRVAQGSRK